MHIGVTRASRISGIGKGDYAITDSRVLRKTAQEIRADDIGQIFNIKFTKSERNVGTVKYNITLNNNGKKTVITAGISGVESPESAFHILTAASSRIKEDSQRKYDADIKTIRNMVDEMNNKQ